VQSVPALRDWSGFAGYAFSFQKRSYACANPVDANFVMRIAVDRNEVIQQRNHVVLLARKPFHHVMIEHSGTSG
jgi:hypothetical protein